MSELEDLKMENERLRAENEELRTEISALKRSPKISFRVSAKGAVSVYGLGRFPVTLYKEQWLRLLDVSEDIKEFIRQNDAQLKSKGPQL